MSVGANWVKLRFYLAILFGLAQAWMILYTYKDTSEVIESREGPSHDVNVHNIQNPDKCHKVSFDSFVFYEPTKASGIFFRLRPQMCGVWGLQWKQQF